MESHRKSQYNIICWVFFGTPYVIYMTSMLSPIETDAVESVLCGRRFFTIHRFFSKAAAKSGERKGEKGGKGRAAITFSVSVNFLWVVVELH